jgi:hypothetical protein
MSETKDDSKATLASYLHENDWEKELNYKMWVTKGARFCASHRLNSINDASTKALTFLSAYLIIIGLVPTFLPTVNDKVPPELIGLSTVGISILVLVYSLIESSRRYSLRAHLYHDCALRIGRLYDALRQAKTVQSGDAKAEEIKRITSDYERTLDLFENHSPIDYAIFQTQKPDYFKLSRRKSFFIRVNAYYHATFRYHLLILLPPTVVAILYYFISSSNDV